MLLLHKPHPKAKFTLNEDAILTRAVTELGTDDWRQIARCLPGRNQRQCRDRWLNYLSPDVSNGPWTPEEEQLLLEKYAEYGAAWKRIGGCFAARTDINIKSRWQRIQRRNRRTLKGIRSEPLPVTVGTPMVRHAKPPPPQHLETKAMTSDDVWASLLMNAEVGGLYDSWY
jgi:hypothetical protein